MLYTTGVGSLPHTETNASVVHVLTYYSMLPFWPQSSGSAAGIDMISQFFPARHLLQPGGLGLAVRGDNPELIAAAEELLERSPYEPDFPLPLGAETLKALVDTIRQADLEPTAVKVQITGPFTVSNLIDSEGVQIGAHRDTMTLLEEVLFACAKRLVFLARQAGVEVWLQLDEPSFPSRPDHPRMPEALDRVLRFFERVRLFFPEVKLGVHACGQRDLSPLLELPEVNFLSIELEPGFLHELIEWLVEEERVLIAGVVDPIFFAPEPDHETIANLAALIMRTAEQLGSEHAALERIAISPTCGLLRVSVAQAEAVARQLLMLRNAVLSVFHV